MTITVPELPSSAKARIVVKCPGGYKRKVEDDVRFTGLRAGTYRIVTKPVRTTIGKATARQRVKKVSVTPNKGARFTVYYGIPGAV